MNFALHQPGDRQERAAPYAGGALTMSAAGGKADLRRPQIECSPAVAAPSVMAITLLCVIDSTRSFDVTNHG
jgi:hypothetical protein